MLPSRHCSSQSEINSPPEKLLKLHSFNAKEYTHEKFRGSKYQNQIFTNPCLLEGKEKYSLNKSLNNNDEKYKSSDTKRKRTNQLFSNSSFNCYVNNEHSVSSDNSSIYPVRDSQFNCSQENYIVGSSSDQIKYNTEFGGGQVVNLSADKVNRDNACSSSPLSSYRSTTGPLSQDLFATPQKVTNRLYHSPGIYKAFSIFL